MRSSDARHDARATSDPVSRPQRRSRRQASRARATTLSVVPAPRNVRGASLDAESMGCDPAGSRCCSSRVRDSQRCSFNRRVNCSIRDTEIWYSPKPCCSRSSWASPYATDSYYSHRSNAIRLTRRSGCAARLQPRLPEGTCISADTNQVWGCVWTCFSRRDFGASASIGIRCILP